MRVLAGLMSIPLVLTALAGSSAEAAGGAPRPGARVAVVEALEVLHDWDRRRAGAWASSDEQAMRSLYLAGSSAARKDVRLLRSYRARGLVVRRIVTQVFGVRLLHRQPGRLTMRVLDRVAGGLVDDGDRELALPSSRPAVRRIEFRRIGGTWKVATVRR